MDSKKFCFITCVNDERWYSECRLYLENLIVPAGFSTEFIPIQNAKSMAS
ncbi:MAG: glycosyl transferase family 2, partial [Selenomonadaceae bacterium]|nr:glycosyl transferase family 2 [Selenomonadaceae bacterium]